MARTLGCPICGDGRAYAVVGYDRRAGPEVFRFLGLPGPVSHWSVCRGCGFLFQNPRPRPEAIVALYASGLYREKRQYGEYFFKRRYLNPIDHFRWFRRLVPGAERFRVLDIGAGHGGAIRAFRDLGAEAEGIEVDPELCDSARRRFNVELIRGEFSAHEFPEASYDLVYSSHTHEHFDDFLAVNRKIHRLLKPGGHLLLVLPTYRWAARNGQGFINVFHNSIFTATSLRNMLVRGDFIPVALRYPFDHSRPEVWAIGRRAERMAKELRRDWPAFVAREIRYGPGLFEAIYRLIDFPLRAARALRRRLVAPDPGLRYSAR